MPFTHPFKYYNQWPCVVLPVCLAADAFIPSLIWFKWIKIVTLGLIYFKSWKSVASTHCFFCIQKLDLDHAPIWLLHYIIHLFFVSSLQLCTHWSRSNYFWTKSGRKFQWMQNVIRELVDEWNVFFGLGILNWICEQLLVYKTVKVFISALLRQVGHVDIRYALVGIADGRWPSLVAH